MVSLSLGEEFDFDFDSFNIQSTTYIQHIQARVQSKTISLNCKRIISQGKREGEREKEQKGIKINPK
jgi:hypothetical protein